MLELLLVGMFTAFWLAALEAPISLLEIIGYPKFVNAVISLLLSLGANLLLGYSTWENLILWTVAGAYLGSALLVIVEKIATLRSTIVNPTR